MVLITKSGHWKVASNLQIYVARPQIKFPWAIYRNRTQSNGKIYCNRCSKCWAIFQHIHSRIETFVTSWDHLLLLVSYKSAAWGWNHCDISACLSEADANRTGISWGARKDENHWARGPGIGWMMIKHLPAECCRRCVNHRPVCGHRSGTAHDEFRSALWSVHSKTLSQTALTSRWVLK